MAGGTNVTTGTRFAVGDLVRASGMKCDPRGPHGIFGGNQDGRPTTFWLNLLPVGTATPEGCYPVEQMSRPDLSVRNPVALQSLKPVALPRGQEDISVHLRLGNRIRVTAILACASLAEVYKPHTRVSFNGVRVIPPSETCLQKTDEAFTELGHLTSTSAPDAIVRTGYAFQQSATSLEGEFPITAAYQHLIGGMLLLWGADEMQKNNSVEGATAARTKAEAMLIFALGVFLEGPSRTDDFMAQCAERILEKY